MSAAGAIGASVTNPSPLAATMLEELQKAYAPYPAIVSAEAIKRGEALVERWAAKQDALERLEAVLWMWLDGKRVRANGKRPDEYRRGEADAYALAMHEVTRAFKALRDGRVSDSLSVQKRKAVQGGGRPMDVYESTRDGRVSEALPKGVTGPAGDSTTSVLMEPHAARPSGDQKNCDHDWEDKSVMRDVCRKCGKEEMA